MIKELAVALVSGGMDSCVTVAYAIKDYNIAFLHLDYGQRTCKKELECFNALFEFYAIKKKLVCSVDYFKKIGGSSLTDKALPVSPSDLESRDVPLTYVPFRNTNILSIAVSWAEVIDAKKIFIGAVEEDGSGYPDCRKEYYEAFNRLVDVGTKDDTKIEVLTPLIDMKKSEIVKLGVSLNAPLNLTWSCYKDADVACGQCDSCVLRLKGFLDAGHLDPIKYI